MIEKLRSYWWFGKTYCAVEISSLDGSDIYYGVTAKKKAGEFIGIESFTAITISDLGEVLSKNQHCYLIINSDKVLIKEAPLHSNESELISKTFPGVSENDFYTEVLKCDERNFVAVCKKEYVDSLLRDFQTKNIEVLGFRLGFFGVAGLLPLLPMQSISTSRQVLKIENSLIQGFEDSTVQQEYVIEDSRVDSNHVLSLSGLFDYVGGSSLDASNISDRNFELASIYKEKVFFRKGMYAGVAIIFALLLINTLLFSKYHSDLQSLQENAALVTSQKDNYIKRKAEVTRKEKIVENVLFSGNSKSSYYINRIVNSQPESIGLNKLEFQPLTRSVRPDKAIEYEGGVIQLSGTSSNKESFGDWIQSLEKMDWIEEVNVSNYAQTGSDKADFSLIIQIEKG
tara:strand:+ start:417953 stop:419149 length:1197 start_codon:yes stop_codon:yes gene_type:complete